jgi:hypothetical protein
MRIEAKPVEIIATPITDDEWKIIGAIAALIVAIGQACN